MAKSITPKPTSKNQVRCKCEICGKEFFWKKPVTICQEKSTCRVLKHQRKTAKERIEKQLTMMSMDAYVVYQNVVEHAPYMKPYIDAFFEKHGASIMEDMLAVLEAEYRGGESLP